MNTQTGAKLDAIHHVAISVEDVAATVHWYREHFQCEVRYQDDTWALLQFANMQLALVVPGEHPPHLSLTSPDAARFGTLNRHRDGTESTYIKDPSGNTVEVISQESLDAFKK